MVRVRFLVGHLTLLASLETTGFCHSASRPDPEYEVKNISYVFSIQSRWSRFTLMQPYTSISCLSRKETENFTHPIKPYSLFAWRKKNTWPKW